MHIFCDYFSPMIRRFYQIDSHPSHRVGGTDSDFSVSLVLPEMSALEKEGLCVVVTKASIPKSFDNVPTGRNTFTLREGATDIKITVPVGTYNAVDFKTTVQQLLNAATVNAYVYTVTFSTRTGRYTVTSTGNSSIITPDAVGFGIHTLLGLAANSTNATPVTSTNKVNFQLTSAVQLRSDVVSANDNVLAPIYAAETEYAASIVYQASDMDTLAKPMAQKNNGAYRFYVTDVDGQILELNGGTVVFELLAYTPLAHLIRAYMRMRTVDIVRRQEPDEKQVMALAEVIRAEHERSLAAAAKTAGDLKAPVDTKAPAPEADVKTAAAPMIADAAPQVPDTAIAEAPALIEDYAELSPDIEGDMVVVPSPTK